eukprot:CAMPEP_0184866646 /NCGR_PEP_ID=MMETSP0580-20130426/23126_1 /TAXON_ID=1118495 /ORGANISM="Dactyliosolen fragilissimus" /LENGTH=413 /DNA_ID=CAMNT_0027366439 /DNA_START=154 /DNA_END=1395 /DNA_ORIENTATION=+
MSSQDNEEIQKKRIVIAGAGVIGTSTAYYLHKNHGSMISSITVVDPTGSVAPAASGKAGGFLALDWNDGSPLGPLARRSFALHDELSKSLGSDKIQYRRLTCASVSVREKNDLKKNKPGGRKLENLSSSDWWSVTEKDGTLTSASINVQMMGDEESIAQVHPKKLCNAMWEDITHNPSIQVELEMGMVVGHEHDKKNNCWKVIVKDEEKEGNQNIERVLEADALLYACGPWTSYANCMYGVKYHSVIVPTRPRVLDKAVFFNGMGDPEVYPRPDGTAYCTGFPDPTMKVTERPGKEEVREDAIKRIVNSVRAASGGGDKDSTGALSADPEIVQSCYLPTTADGLPIMGIIESRNEDYDYQGNDCFVAAGHGCWGILLGPATGEAMASLIATGKSSPYVNLSLFDPLRFNDIGL